MITGEIEDAQIRKAIERLEKLDSRLDEAITRVKILEMRLDELVSAMRSENDR